MAQEGIGITPKIYQIALTDLIIPDWNPRKFIDEGPLQNLMGYIEKGGLVPRILVWREKGQTPYAVISGQRRSEAYRRLGKTHIEAEELHITLEEAKFMAIASNQDDKPYWLGEFTAVETLMSENDQLQQVDIIKKLGWPKKRVSYAVALMKLLNPASRQLIDQASRPKVPSRNFSESQNPNSTTQDDPWRLTEAVAARLIPLLDKTSLVKSQSLAEKAVKILISRQLTGSQTETLVAQALSGQDLIQFEPAAKTPNSRKPVHRHPTHSLSSAPAVLPLTGDPLDQSWANAASPKPQAEGSGLSVPISPKHEMGASTPKPQATAEHTPPPVNSEQTLSTGEALLWDALAGVSVVARIQTKIKKGQRPSLLEALILAGDVVWRALAWLGKHAIRLGKPVLKTAAKLLKGTVKFVFKALGRTFYNLVRVVVILAVVGFLGWIAYDVFINGILPQQALKDTFSTVVEGALLFWRQG